LIGVLVAIASRDRRYVELPADETSAVQRYLRGLAIAMLAGLGSGVTIAGAGGRLAMRLLAVTGPDASVGRLTEADEVVGRVTVDGTIGVMIFVGLGFGLASSGLYALLRRWLPGRTVLVSGAAFGVLLLLIPALVVDPLRKDNPDFQLVGPGWVALLVFGALAIVHGIVVAAFATRFSAVVPPFDTRARRRALLWYAPILLLALVGFAAVPLIAVGLIVMGLERTGPTITRALRSPAALVTGRAALAIAAVAALPFFVATAADILRSSP
jgi:hypothetical protein